jgi:hypothetical protein
MTCENCIHDSVCGIKKRLISSGSYFFTEYGNCKEIEKHCGNFKNKADFVEVVRCKECIHSQELDKHCEINRSAYRHCNMWRGEEEKNVWHSYKKYRKDYSIVELDGFCDMGERSDT